LRYGPLLALWLLLVLLVRASGRPDAYRRLQAGMLATVITWAVMLVAVVLVVWMQVDYALAGPLIAALAVAAFVVSVAAVLPRRRRGRPG
jgi:multisubunit Na+/H+ antiporter MnhG subunit